MRLHLILPGLLWPGKALHNATYDLDLPALSWMLGRGHLVWDAPWSLETRLCHSFGIDRAEPPAAALRLLGSGGQPGTDLWLCADPVHLHIEKGRMTFSGEMPAMTPEDIREIQAALAGHLAEAGAFHVDERGCGYLRLKAPPGLRTVPPSAASGEGSLLPQGEDAPLWRRLNNEAQMLLHALPLNARREEEKRPTLNSLWFWGAGDLPPRQPCTYDQVAGNHPLLAGLAAWAQQPLTALPASAAGLLESPARSTLALIDTLQSPMRRFDAMDWAERLTGIERDWLQPLRQALRSGRLHSLRLTALGDEASLDVTLTRGAAWRFWRGAQPLHGLVYHLPAGI